MPIRSANSPHRVLNAVGEIGGKVSKVIIGSAADCRVLDFTDGDPAENLPRLRHAGYGVAVAANMIARRSLNYE
jgi:hypothetical protein